MYIHTAGQAPEPGAVSFLKSAVACLLGGDAAVELIAEAAEDALAALRANATVFVLPLVPLPASTRAARRLEALVKQG